jgi:hypothetical protein
MEGGPYSYVVLFVQAHGEEDLSLEFVEKTHRVQLLSFSGKPDTYGMMDICPDGESLDIKALKIATQAMKRTKNPETSLKASIPNLQTAYEQSNIFFRNGGFRITNPVSERTFYFKPNRGEDPKLCPEYGLTVVQSSLPDDFDHTLESNWMSTEKTESKNIHMNRRNQSYWRQKIRIEKEIYVRLFDRMISEKMVTLSDLINIFWKGMGFDLIYIFDPSCRHCGVDAKMIDEYSLAADIHSREATLLPHHFRKWSTSPRIKCKPRQTISEKCQAEWDTQCNVVSAIDEAYKYVYASDSFDQTDYEQNKKELLESLILHLREYLPIMYTRKKEIIYGDQARKFPIFKSPEDAESSLLSIPCTRGKELEQCVIKAYIDCVKLFNYADEVSELQSQSANEEEMITKIEKSFRDFFKYFITKYVVHAIQPLTELEKSELYEICTCQETPLDVRNVDQTILRRDISTLDIKKDIPLIFFGDDCDRMVREAMKKIPVHGGKRRTKKTRRKNKKAKKILSMRRI